MATQKPCVSTFQPIHAEGEVSADLLNRIQANIQDALTQLAVCQGARLNAVANPVVIGGTTTITTTVPSLISIGGIIAEDGLDGPKGMTGIQGAPGPDGEDNTEWFPGPAGPQGATGLQGRTGAPSIDGDDGEQGQPGPQGPQGLQGTQGTQGAPGIDGDDGEQGPPGTPGTPGPTGPQGTSSANGDSPDDSAFDDPGRPFGIAVSQTGPLTGDVTKPAGSTVTTNVNAPTGFTHAGRIVTTAIAAPGTPGAGTAAQYVDSTSKNFASKDDAGNINHGVRTKAATASNWLTSIADDGTSVLAQPAATDLQNISGATYIGNGTASSHAPQVLFLPTNGQLHFTGTSAIVGDAGAVYDTTKGLQTVSKRSQWAAGAGITGAATLTLGTDGNYFVISGTPAISFITTTNWQAGAIVTLQVNNGTSFVHAAGGSSQLFLPNGTFIVQSPNGIDFVAFQFNGSSWNMLGSDNPRFSLQFLDQHVADVGVFPFYATIGNSSASSAWGFPCPVVTSNVQGALYVFTNSLNAAFTATMFLGGLSSGIAFASVASSVTGVVLLGFTNTATAVSLGQIIGLQISSTATTGNLTFTAVLNFS